MRDGLKGAAVLAMAVLAGSAARAEEKLKVGFVYVGPVGDFGYSYQHDQGRQFLQKQLGDKVETTFLENVAENDSQRAFEQLARSGHKLIFGTSFGFMDPMLKVAKQFPKVDFEHATGYKGAPNLATYSARFYEGRYIMGEIAAKVSKTHTVGYIASFPIPEVVSGIDAFMLGAQKIDPNFKVKIVWVNTWFDPGKEADAAKALIAQGVDVIAQHTDSAAPLQEAEKAGVHGFGQSSDMAKFAPKAILTSLEDNWGPYYVGEVKAVQDGHLEAARHLGRARGRHGGDGPLREHARRREGDGGEDRGRHQVRRREGLRGADRQAGRHGGRQERRGDARQGDPRAELVREGRGRHGSAMTSPRLRDRRRHFRPSWDRCDFRSLGVGRSFAIRDNGENNGGTSREVTP